MSIDCPSDCTHLVASRRYDEERREVDWSKLPFPAIKISPSFAQEHLALLNALSYAICQCAHENRAVVDSDVVAATQALAETYRTLASGIYYENPPAYSVQRGLYEALKAALKDFREEETKHRGMSVTRDADIRDALIFFTQLGATRTNGRPKGRAYLDLLRRQFKPGEFAKAPSKIVLLP